jgi:hypothetical protein
MEVNKEREKKTGVGNSEGSDIFFRFMQSLRISQYQVANTLQSILLKFGSILEDNWEDVVGEGNPSFVFNVPHKFQNKWYFKLNTSLAYR